MSPVPALMALCWLPSQTSDWRYWAMSVSSALLSRRLAGGSCRLWCVIPSPRPLIHVRSASVAEPGRRRSNEEQLWEAAGYLPFTRARIGPFFQENPVLKNPFVEDALLRGYLKRHIPQEVSRGYMFFPRKGVILPVLEQEQQAH